MSIYNIKQQRRIVLLFIFGLGVFLAYSLKDIFTAFLGAITLYTLFKPFYLSLAEEKRWDHSLSAVIIMLISFLLIIIPFLSLSWIIMDKIIYYRSNPEPIAEIINRIDGFLGSELNRPRLVERLLKNMETWALGSFTSLLNALFNVFLIITLMYFILYFMLKNHFEFENAILKYLPFNESSSMLFAEEMKNITYANVLGQGLIALIQGILLSVGFVIFGLKDPVFWGVVCVLLSFLPVIGSPMVFVPAGLISISFGDTFGGVGIMLWGFILVMNIDNVLRMLIAKKIGDTHPLITIIGVVVGIPIFGILGLVFGPLLLSYFILLITLYEQKFVSKAKKRVEIAKKEKPDNGKV